ncbi:hypothetical protein RDI58_010613 [Solanum bulbocastanum]|uniref:Uncharacterized protein n=1 Tax=Solanum bulbocastanum TaxID=147425 RepID=A0AAN8YGI7_SOLBU
MPRQFVRYKGVIGNVSSIASDPCDYDMGDYDCSDGGHRFEDDGDYGGNDDIHDQELNGNKSYYSGGEYEENYDHSSYSEDEEDKKPFDGSYDDDGASERSYSHFESKMVPMMVTEHITLPTPRMKVRGSIILSYKRILRSMMIRSITPS